MTGTCLPTPFSDGSSATGSSPSVRAKVAWATRRLPSTWQCPGIGGPPRRPSRCRRLRVFGPGDVGPLGRTCHKRRQGDPADDVRVEGHVDGLFRGRPPARHMAAPDAPQSARTVPGQRRLGWPRFLVVDMPPGTGRRGVIDVAVPACVPGLRGHDAPARGQEGNAARPVRWAASRACRCGASSRTCAGSPFLAGPGTTPSARVAVPELAEELGVPLLGHDPRGVGRTGREGSRPSRGRGGAVLRAPQPSPAAARIVELGRRVFRAELRSTAPPAGPVPRVSATRAVMWPFGAIMGWMAEPDSRNATPVGRRVVLGMLGRGCGRCGLRGPSFPGHRRRPGSSDVGRRGDRQPGARAPTISRSTPLSAVTRPPLLTTALPLTAWSSALSASASPTSRRCRRQDWSSRSNALPDGWSPMSTGRVCSSATS